MPIAGRIVGSILLQQPVRARRRDKAGPLRIPEVTPSEIDQGGRAGRQPAASAFLAFSSASSSSSSSCHIDIGTE